MSDNLCECGRPISDNQLALHERFPSIVARVCDTCQDRIDAEAAKETEKRKEKERKAEHSARLERVPPELRRTNTEHPQFNRELWPKVAGWHPRSGRWLGIVGPSGECKSRCIALIASRLIMEGVDVEWTTATEFQDKVEELRMDKARFVEAKRYFERIRRATVLVFDDLGKNTWTPTLERHLFRLIDDRKSFDRAVLWSANTHPLELCAMLSEDRAAPLVGRIVEASRIIEINPENPS